MKNIKSYLLVFILGGICFYSISVFAEYVVSADKVKYSSNISIKDKIDDLYTRVKPVYNGNIYKFDIFEDGDYRVNEVVELKNNIKEAMHETNFNKNC